MTRLLLVLILCFSCVSLASASLTPQRELPALGRKALRAQANQPSVDIVAKALPRAAAPEFIVTERTEILLNGQPCRYQDLPPDARITSMELAVDGKTILYLHCRTHK